jgi:hypothetical protein
LPPPDETPTAPRSPAGSTARLYHELTSFSLEGISEDSWPVPATHPLVRQDFEANHLPTFPAPFKAYPPGLPRLALTRMWPAPSTPAMEVLAGTRGALPDRDADRPLHVDDVARLLHLSAAVVRFAERRDGRRFFFRTSRSAGGRFPLELYVSSKDVDGLPDGVHWYDALRHGLVHVGPPALGDATTIVVTGVPWRTSWRYSERGFRHLYWDAGTTLAHSLALCDAAGIEARLLSRFPDDEVAGLVGADGVQELPLALLALGGGEPAIRPSGAAVPGAVAEDPLEFPLITFAQRAGDAVELGEPWPPRPGVAGEPLPSADLDAVILRNKSTRVFDANAAIGRDDFEWCVRSALRGTTLPTYIAVHAVDGLEPGLYRWPDLAMPARAGDLREELFRVCMNQELGRDAAFVVLSAVDLDRLDDRGYRDAQLGAGLVDGWLHLGAYALGFGASGMTFIDSEIAGLVGEPLAGLLITCLGRRLDPARA